MAYGTTQHRIKTDELVPDTPSSTAVPAGAFLQPDANAVMITFAQTTTAAPLVPLADNTTTADVTIQIGTGNGSSVSLQTPVSGHRIVRPLTTTVPPGCTVYVYMSALTSPNASTQQVIVYLTPYQS
jgi:hypothetical protein